MEPKKYCHSICRFQKFCGHEENESCPINACFQDLECFSYQYRAGINPVLRYEVAHPALDQVHRFPSIERALGFVKDIDKEIKLKKFFQDWDPPSVTTLPDFLIQNGAELKEIMGWCD